jgi:hypothetical protein
MHGRLFPSLILEKALGAAIVRPVIDDIAVGLYHRR